MLPGSLAAPLGRREEEVPSASSSPVSWCCREGVWTCAGACLRRTPRSSRGAAACRAGAQGRGERALALLKRKGEAGMDPHAHFSDVAVVLATSLCSMLPATETSVLSSCRLLGPLSLRRPLADPTSGLCVCTREVCKQNPARLTLSTELGCLDA